jgi:hypothetical protein
LTYGQILSREMYMTHGVNLPEPEGQRPNPPPPPPMNQDQYILKILAEAFALRKEQESRSDSGDIYAKT